MTTKAKARALARARMKPKRKQEKILAEQQELLEESQKMALVTKKNGVKGLALIVFDHILKREEHILAQAGALGIYREHLKTTPSKTRLSLQPYDQKQVDISGILTDVKFNARGEIIALMIANPKVTTATNTNTFIDSHLWLHINKLSHIQDETFEFQLGLGCMLNIEAIVKGYTSHGKYKYGVDLWAVKNCGISYFYPNPDGRIAIITLGNEDSKISAPFFLISNTPETASYTLSSKEDYQSKKDFLMNNYFNMQNNIHVSGKKGMSALSKKTKEFIEKDHLTR